MKLCSKIQIPDKLTVPELKLFLSMKILKKPCENFRVVIELRCLFKS